jgi:hypothetical protein|tara:strand:+ start:7320 stop:7502 length:183 start_codon:yes stop_codon:yes gene_type:complete
MSTTFPKVQQIFDDLDEYRDFCRFNGKVFNEKDLYKESSRIYKEFLAFKARGNKKYYRRK